MKEMFKIAHRGRYKHKLRSEFSKTGEKSKKKREKFKEKEMTVQVCTMQYVGN